MFTLTAIYKANEFASLVFERIFFILKNLYFVDILEAISVFSNYQSPHKKIQNNDSLSENLKNLIIFISFLKDYHINKSINCTCKEKLEAFLIKATSL